MRAIRFGRYGGPEVLELAEVPVPRPGAGEVLIEVGAAGVTLPVVRLTRGGPDGGVPLPQVPGGEVAGRIVEVGAGVSGEPGTGWRVGERVTGLAFSGAYAEFATVPVEFLSRVPDGVDDATAVVLVRSGHVAFAALHLAALREGESVLVTSAAGGVGHLAVQLARALGAGRVVAAAGAGAGRIEFLRGLGADRAVTYDEARAGLAESFDVVLDGAGANVQEIGLAALAPLGRFVSYNAVGGKLFTNELRMTARTVIGLAMRHFVAHRPDVYERHGQRLWELLERGALRPAVHAVLPLEQAADAHRVIEARTNLGKMVLTPAAKP